MGARFDRRIDQLTDRHRRAQIVIFDPILFNAAVLDIQDLPHADAVFILAHRTGDNFQTDVLYSRNQFVFR